MRWIWTCLSENFYIKVYPKERKTIKRWENRYDIIEYNGISIKISSYNELSCFSTCKISDFFLKTEVQKARCYLQSERLDCTLERRHFLQYQSWSLFKLILFANNRVGSSEMYRWWAMMAWYKILYVLNLIVLWG